MPLKLDVTNVEIGGMAIALQLALLGVSLLVVAFFSSSEASLIAVNKFRIRHLAQEGNRAAQAVQRIASKHDKFFATILLTENASIILATSLGTALAISLLGEGGAAVATATVVMTVLIVMFGEITPKSLAAQAAGRWSLVVARAVEAIMTLETFLIYLFTLPPRLVLWLLGGRELLETPSVTEGELRMLVDIGRAEGVVEKAEATLIENVFRFGDRQVREVMTPRTEVVALERGTTLEQFLQVYGEHAHTRFPVYERTIDNVLGILSVKDVVRALAAGQLKSSDDATHLLRPAQFVPETKLAGQLFQELKVSGHQVVIAVDEFGGMAGLATLKQLVEEIVGPVGEEGAPAAEEEFQAIDPHTYEVDGTMRTDEVNERLGLALPEGDYETIAGFILSRLGHIPAVGESLHHGGHLLEVTEMEGVRVRQVRLTRVSPPGPPAGQ
ncbi:MAG: HlyC/CorC family transporter [Chloroflexi bacterium]|nr:HlyC/CorC family transporter [Chloroflexota bacterium]